MRKTHRRLVYPFKNRFAEVDLYEIIEGFKRAPYPEEIDPVLEWIEHGAVTLRVFSLRDTLGQSAEQRVLRTRTKPSGTNRTRN